MKKFFGGVGIALGIMALISLTIGGLVSIFLGLPLGEDAVTNWKLIGIGVVCLLVLGGIYNVCDDGEDREYKTCDACGRKIKGEDSVHIIKGEKMFDFCDKKCFAKVKN